MKSKADAHHSLATLFSCDGIPDTMIIDGTGELTGDEFKKKARDVDCRVKKVTERSSPRLDTRKLLVITTGS